MRYAVFWAPPRDSALWRFGSRWLGRDAATGQAFPAPSPRHGEITAEARRYGLHATLKAPISLVDGASRADVCRVLQGLAARFTPFAGTPWVLTNLGGFLALTPDPRFHAGRPPLLHVLADSCVLALEPLRRAATPEEIARRRPERLAPRARAYLHRFGYHWVLEEFVAHLTLTCRLDNPERARVAAELRAELAALPPEPPPIAEIALFVEDAPGASFRIAETFPLGVQR